MSAHAELDWFSKVAERTEQQLADSLAAILRTENQQQCHPSDAKRKFHVKITVQISQLSKDI